MLSDPMRRLPLLIVISVMDIVIFTLLAAALAVFSLHLR
jgi:hypothetical protein